LHYVFTNVAENEMLPLIVFESNEKAFFPSPLGFSSGIDRQGRALDGLLDLGNVGFVEIGPVTIDP
jgi:dihydroorotate dehydrogenase